MPFPAGVSKVCVCGDDRGAVYHSTSLISPSSKLRHGGIMLPAAPRGWVKENTSIFRSWVGWSTVFPLGCEPGCGMWGIDHCLYYRCAW